MAVFNPLFVFVAEKEAFFLGGVTKDDVIQFYNKYVRADAPNRAKIAVYVYGKNINSCKVSKCFILVKYK